MTDLSQDMMAIEISAPGGPEVLKAVRRALPQPGPGELLVKVEAAGVNRPDLLQRAGLYPAPADASDLPGLEIAGTVVAIGAGADRFRPGSPVCALVEGGGYAEYCIAREGQCLPVPSGLTMAEAAALPETLFTVWHNLFERAYAAEGETVLVHGGTSGIGCMAITLAKLFGLTIIVTCGSDPKCAAALKMGADHAINYKEKDFVEAVQAVTSGKGVNVVLDMVAGSYVGRNLQCLAPDGRHVTIAVQGGMQAEINMAMLMMRRLTMTGSTLRARDAEFKALLTQEIAEVVWPFAESGELRPHIHARFPLTEATKAHEMMESGAHVGKIVLEVKS